MNDNCIKVADDACIVLESFTNADFPGFAIGLSSNDDGYIEADMAIVEYNMENDKVRLIEYKDLEEDYSKIAEFPLNDIKNVFQDFSSEHPDVPDDICLKISDDFYITVEKYVDDNFSGFCIGIGYNDSPNKIDCDLVSVEFDRENSSFNMYCYDDIFSEEFTTKNTVSLNNFYKVMNIVSDVNSNNEERQHLDYDIRFSLDNHDDNLISKIMKDTKSYNSHGVYYYPPVFVGDIKLKIRYNFDDKKLIIDGQDFNGRCLPRYLGTVNIDISELNKRNDVTEFKEELKHIISKLIDEDKNLNFSKACGDEKFKELISKNTGIWEKMYNDYKNLTKNK